MTRTKTNLKPSASKAPIYPSKLDAMLYVEKRVANDLCIQTYGRELGWNKEIEAICDLWTPEEIVDRAMTATKYYNVVTGRMEEADERYTKFDWWEVIDEDALYTIDDDSLFCSFDNYVELYNLNELAG